MTDGAGETALHGGVDKRFVVDCKLNPGTLVGQVTITFAPERAIASCGVAAQAGAVTEKFLNATLTPGVIAPGQMESSTLLFEELRESVDAIGVQMPLCR